MASKVTNIIFLLTLINVIIASSDILNAQNIKNSDFNYILSESSSDNYSLEIINELSRITGKHLNEISARIAFKESFYTENTNNEVTAHFSLKTKAISGDTSYKGFSISNLLIPSAINYKLKLTAGNNRIVNANISQTTSFNKNRNIDFAFSFSDSANSNNITEIYELFILSRNLSYDSNSVKNFKAYIRLTDDYFNSVSLINETEKLISNINPDSAEMIAAYDLQLKEAEKNYNLIMNKNFQQALNLNYNDPENLNNRLKHLNERIILLRTSIDKSFGSLDKTYTIAGIKRLKEGDEKGARSSFIHAIEFNPLYAPAQLETAKLNIRNGNLFAAADSIIKIATLMKPDINITEDIRDASDLLNASFLARGNELMVKEDYTSAISIAEKGIYFCSNMPGIICNENLLSLLSKAKTGLYNSYLKISRKALINNRIDMAASYLEMAETYKSGNINEINDNHDAEAIREGITDAYTSKGMHYLSSGNYNKALEYFDLAAKSGSALVKNGAATKISGGMKQAKTGIYKDLVIKSSNALKKEDITNAELFANEALAFQKENSEFINSTLGTDTLISNIKLRKYEALIFKGQKLLGYGQYDSSLVSLMQAKEMEKAWVFKRNLSLDSLLSASAKPVILEKLATAQVKTWGNNIPEAEKYFKEAYTMQHLYGLSNDKTITGTIEDINTKINNRECQNALEEYNKYYSQALKSISAANYILTGEYLDKAIGVAYDNPGCNIPIIIASEKKSEYTPAITYQNLTVDAKDAYNAGDYKKCIIIYRTAAQYYVDYRVSNTGLTHMAFRDFLILNDKTEFIFYCINYFYESKMYNDALAALCILKNKNIPTKQTLPLQKKLGISMGIYDRERQTNEKAGVLLMKYTGNDRFFRSFRYAYRRGWHKAGPFFNFKKKN